MSTFNTNPFTKAPLHIRREAPRGVFRETKFNNVLQPKEKTAFIENNAWTGLDWPGLACLFHHTTNTSAIARF